MSSSWPNRSSLARKLLSIEPVAILVGPKGRGSNMAALAEACLRPDSPARIARVVAPAAEAPALARARDLGLETTVVPYGDDFGPRLAAALQGCTFLCLAGFMRLLPDEVLRQMPGRVLNIHPALLPKFGGKGMYGERVHAAVLEAGEAESGCTVHLVTERYDEGPILRQERCPVLPGDTPETLGARVLACEHRAYPQALFEVIRARAAA